MQKLNTCFHLASKLSLLQKDTSADGQLFLCSSNSVPVEHLSRNGRFCSDTFPTFSVHDLIRLPGTLEGMERGIYNPSIEVGPLCIQNLNTIEPGNKMTRLPHSWVQNWRSKFSPQKRILFTLVHYWIK